MPITDIKETKNPNGVTFKPIKEKQDIFIPGITNLNISRRNGMIYAMSGSGGSGKTNLLLNLFRSTKCYRNKFYKIYYFCPPSSFSSLENHPFATHEDVYHELTVPHLATIYNELIQIKGSNEDMGKKKKKNSGYDDDEESDELSDDEREVQYSCVIIDDFADRLKDIDIQKMLNKMLIKARHLCCGFIFTLQSFYYLPKIFRKQLTFITIFKPKNTQEWYSVANELLNMRKDDAIKLYDYVFDKPYMHLDIDTTTDQIYKNFNILTIKE
jgi:hypothetical protein